MCIFKPSKKRLIEENIQLTNELNEMYEKFPFEMGEIVYDVQLRSATGKYTKTKPSREHCLINEVEVDEKNYFKLKTRFKSKDVFRTRSAAEKYLDTVCVE